MSEVISSHVEEKDTIDLCKLLTTEKPRVTDAIRILAALKGKNPESVRIQVSNYLTTCVLTSKKEGAILEFARRLDCFKNPVSNAQAFNEIILNTLEAIGG